MADLFKTELARLEEHTRALSIRLSQRCWDAHSSKRKSDYQQCALEATTLLHVFTDGRKRLKAKKRELLQSCVQRDPDQARQCRMQALQQLQPHLDSLVRKLEREQQYLEELFASKHRPSNNVATN